MRENDPHIRCTLCGEMAHASWHGTVGNISVCKNCAVDLLPMLIADAIWLPEKRQDGAIGFAQRYWTEAEKNFWRSIACRVCQN